MKKNKYLITWEMIVEASDMGIAEQKGIRLMYPRRNRYGCIKQIEDWKTGKTYY